MFKDTRDTKARKQHAVKSVRGEDFLEYHEQMVRQNTEVTLVQDGNRKKLENHYDKKAYADQISACFSKCHRVTTVVFGGIYAQRRRRL